MATVDPRILAAGGLVLLVLLLAVLWLWRRRSRRRDTDRRLRGASRALLTDFLIPDGSGGTIQAQYAVLTGRGVVVIDIKDVDGHVFGSEGMQDWTVIAARRRFTFTNPQPGLWDRMAAVKRLLPDVPVTGWIAFTARAQFSKGRPRSVAMLDSLLDELERDHAAGGGQADGYLASWDGLRQAAIDVRMDHLLRREPH